MESHTMNRFRRLKNKEETLSVEDNDPLNQLKACKDQLRDMSNVLKNLSNKL